MTDCTAETLVLASVDRRQIVADFGGGDLTSDGGLPLLREVDRKIGLIDALDGAIDDPRCQWLIEHDQRTILAQRIVVHLAGGFPLQATLKIILRRLRDWRCIPSTMTSRQPGAPIHSIHWGWG
jgi:hypothetical protein